MSVDRRVVHRAVCPLVGAAELFAALQGECPEVVWLDSAVQDGDRGNRSMLVLEMEASRASAVTTSRLEALDVEFAADRANGGIGWVGFVSYDAATASDEAIHPRPWRGPVPPRWEFRRVLACVIWSRDAENPELVTTDADAPTGRRRLERWQSRIQAWATGATNALSISRSAPPPDVGIGGGPLVADLTIPDRAQVGAHVRRILEWIHAGVVFQACYTFPILCRPLVGLPQIYLALRERQGGDFGTYMRLGQAELASVSPERLCQVSQGWVRTRPMKGTRRRVLDDAAADARVAEELRTSAKDRAENVMIVDLLRNDLGRVCEPRSVCVTELFAIESYATVHQMTSTVSGRVRAGVGPFGLLAAAFPPGSMTGAPKVEACNRLSELEGRPRGLYAGTVAWLGFDGEWVFSVVIRALQNDVYSDEPAGSGVCSWWVGGGIVADSDPEAEWDEAISKAAPLLALCGGAVR